MDLLQMPADHGGFGKGEGSGGCQVLYHDEGVHDRFFLLEVMAVEDVVLLPVEICCRRFQVRQKG